MTSKNLRPYLTLFLLVLGMALAIYFINRQGNDAIRLYIQQMGVWGPIGLFSLRLISVIIPAVPGTFFSLLGGSLFGFWQGLAIICAADLISCTASFAISRYLGRNFVEKIIKKESLARIDKLCNNYLNQNFLLMTGFLMTGFFDFVAYGVGLTKTRFRMFFPALIISILLSNPPVIAVAAGIFEGGKILLIIAAFGMVGLGIISQILKKKYLTP